MPLTILGPSQQKMPTPLYPAVCQVRRKWTDKWTTVPELSLQQCTVNAGGHDLDSAEVEWKYGPEIKHPFDSDYRTIRPVNPSGWWLRVCLAGEQGLQPIWVGRFLGEGREVQGAEAGPSGVQRLQAYGPQKILMKLAVSKSLWVPPAGSTGHFPNDDWWCGWLPGMNDRVGHHGFLIGNRSPDRYAPTDYPRDGTYVYGGTDLWTAFDYLEYILWWFADWSDSKGPRFQLGGQTDILKSMTFAQAWPEHTTVAHMLQELISPRYGIDFKIELDGEKGWIVSVYSLQSKDATWADATLPANPHTVGVKAGESMQNVSTHVVRTDDHRYAKIRVLGKRIIIAASFDQNVDGDVPLLPAWPAAIETDYLNAVGAAPAGADLEGRYPPGSAQLADLIRHNHRYRDVYSVYMAPALFDPKTVSAAIRCNADGTLTLGSDSEQPPRQCFIRHTLPWLPLRADFDYSTGWPGTQMEVAYDPEQAPQFMRPMVWLVDTAISADNGPFFPADQCAVGVAALKHGLGIRLHTRPNHRAAPLPITIPADHPTDHVPQFDTNQMVTTIAWESDTRLAIEYDIPGSDPADGTLEIYVPEAEVWCLAPNTAVALHPTNPRQFILSPNVLTVVRDDRARLYQIMAGAVARYGKPRMRAEISAAGFLPWGGLLGQIMTCLESGGESEQIEAPITQITWHGGAEPRTTVRTGYARGD